MLSTEAGKSWLQGISQFSGEAETIRESAQKVEQTLRLKIEELTAQLANNQSPTDDWAVAQDVEKTLKVNLEAIKITQDELDRKARL